MICRYCAVVTARGYGPDGFDVCLERTTDGRRNRWRTVKWMAEYCDSNRGTVRLGPPGPYDPLHDHRRPTDFAASVHWWPVASIRCDSKTESASRGVTAGVWLFRLFAVPPPPGLLASRLVRPLADLLPDLDDLPPLYITQIVTDVKVIIETFLPEVRKMFPRSMTPVTICFVIPCNQKKL